MTHSICSLFVLDKGCRRRHVSGDLPNCAWPPSLTARGTPAQHLGAAFPTVPPARRRAGDSTLGAAMPSDDHDPVPSAARPRRPRRPRRPLKRFSAEIAREICRRTVAGETLAQICADPAMPCAMTFHRWAKRHAVFARRYAGARALGEQERAGRRRSYCPDLANEICARVSEGESMARIADDPAMPSMRTIYRWREHEPDFAEALVIARAAAAERLSDTGWTLAMAATPSEAHLTRVRLHYLRWLCAVHSPATHGRLKPIDPPQPPQPPEARTVLLRSFRIERHPDYPAVNQHRVVGYCPDPDTLQPVRDSEGPWTDIVDPVAKAAAIDALCRRREADNGRPPA